MMPTPQRPAGTVLLVDDDSDLAKSLRELIRALGYRAVYARNGREAVSALRHDRPDLMLVDLCMPVMDGSELLELVRRSPEWSGIPIAIMTGTKDPTIVPKEGAPVFYKPIDLDTLVRFLRSAPATSARS
jgi:two-component system, sensor histidine kinase